MTIEKLRELKTDIETRYAYAVRARDGKRAAELQPQLRTVTRQIDALVSENRIAQSARDWLKS